MSFAPRGVAEHPADWRDRQLAERMDEIAPEAGDERVGTVGLAELLADDATLLRRDAEALQADGGFPRCPP